MKPFISASKQFFAQIWADAMLAVLVFVPPMMGLAFRFGVPALEAFICTRTGKAQVLAPYYPLFDLLLCSMTPIMFTAAGALVILDEADSGISRALVTSPLGRRGYLASRIGAPTVLAALYCVFITALFQLSGISTARILVLALCAGALGFVTALMIPSLAKNKVEGMAASKLSGLIMLGLPAAILLPSPIKYVFGLLPTLWMTELVMGGSLLYALPALAASALLALLFAGRFKRRVL